MKRIISLGAAFLLVLSAGMVSYAGHHTPCLRRVIQGSGLCRYGESQAGGHHLFGHDGWMDCGVCGVDVGAICERWESCHEGYGTGTACPWQGADVVPESQPTVGAVPESQPSVSAAPESRPTVGAVPESQPTVSAVPESQPTVSAVPESQPSVSAAPGNQAQAQTGSGTGAADTGTYGAGAGYQNYNGAGYGSGDCYSGCYTTGHHGSGHHGHGHH